MEQIFAFPNDRIKPKVNDDGTMDIIHNSGMTLLDYFAGQYACGLASDHNYTGKPQPFAADCYTFAKALMEERKKHLK